MQVINGLMEREDWSTAIKTPIGVLPGGSANALASALAHRVGYERLLTTSLVTFTFSLLAPTVPNFLRQAVQMFKCLPALGLVNIILAPTISS